MFMQLINCNVEQDKITILSQYRAQCSEIERTLKSFGYEHPNVNTVIASQGKQCIHIWNKPSSSSSDISATYLDVCSGIMMNSFKILIVLLTSNLFVLLGDEWDYVILSLVRSMPEYEIEKSPSIGWCKRNMGFITDEHQINVALTRARLGLIILGRTIAVYFIAVMLYHTVTC